LRGADRALSLIGVGLGELADHVVEIRRIDVARHARAFNPRSVDGVCKLAHVLFLRSNTE